MAGEKNGRMKDEVEAITIRGGSPDDKIRLYREGGVTSRNINNPAGMTRAFRDRKCDRRVSSSALPLRSSETLLLAPYAATLRALALTCSALDFGFASISRCS